MIATEYELLTERAGLLDRSERAKFVLRGPEAASFLQGQVTNDVEALAPGTGLYAVLLSHKGKLRTDVRVLRADDELYLDTEAIGRRVIEHTLQTYTVGLALEWRDVTDATAVLSLLGPGAREALELAPPDAEHAFVEGVHGRYVTTDLGVDVICAAQDAAGVQAALGVESVSEEAAECLRIEAGRPRLGRDMGSETIPQEAGLNERAVSFTKGCYVGQETVARLHYKGKPNRHLRGLRLSEPAAHGDPIRGGGRELGKVGSACVSPALGPIALAIVRREAALGDTVLVGEPGSPGELVELPFRR